MSAAPSQRAIVPSWAALTAANTIPVFGVLFAGWGLFPLVFLYSGISRMNSGLRPSQTFLTMLS